MFSEDLPAALRPLVRVLDETSSRALWERHVSNDPKQRHPMVLQKPHWLDSNRWSDTRWSPWETEPASTFLARALPWVPMSEVYFVASRSRSYALPWSVFLDTHCAFVRHDNELSFVFSLETLDFVLFGPPRTDRPGPPQRRTIRHSGVTSSRAALCTHARLR